MDYDYNVDRFLHYFLMEIAQPQRSSKDYRIDRKVYAFVVLTARCKIDEKTRIPVKDGVQYPPWTRAT